MKLPTNKVEGEYACPCGNSALNVTATTLMVLKDNTLESVQPSIMDDAEIVCPVCGLSAPGYVFNRAARDLGMMVSLLVRYITTMADAEELSSDTLSQTLHALIGVKLNKVEAADGKVRYTFIRERPAEKPVVSSEEKKA